MYVCVAQLVCCPVWSEECPMAAQSQMVVSRSEYRAELLSSAGAATFVSIISPARHDGF